MPAARIVRGVARPDDRRGAGAVDGDRKQAVAGLSAVVRGPGERAVGGDPGHEAVESLRHRLAGVAHREVGRAGLSGDDQRAVRRDADAVRLVCLAAAEIGGEGQRSAVGRHGGHERDRAPGADCHAGERLDDGEVAAQRHACHMHPACRVHGQATHVVRLRSAEVRQHLHGLSGRIESCHEHVALAAGAADARPGQVGGRRVAGEVDATLGVERDRCRFLDAVAADRHRVGQHRVDHEFASGVVGPKREPEDAIACDPEGDGHAAGVAAGCHLPRLRRLEAQADARPSR